ncbi:MAG: hypothetical protein ACWGNI_00175 [Desulfobacterales bacterium]
MNWLFLRGRMERHSECKWNSLDECTDMWSHLFANMINEEDFGTILYSNGNRVKDYRNNFYEHWIPKLKNYDQHNKPDIIVARGGFKEYVPLLKKYPKAKKVYYGANHGCIPKDGIKYDLIMCDSEEQVKKCKKHGLNGKLFIKPAAPQFYPREVEKKYDVGFSAIWPKDKRKNVSWVHKTCPKYLKVLQMGHACKAPSNVSVKLIEHDKMPRAISKCKVIIAPYTSEDSCPRIIPEALACSVPVVALDTCQFWREKYFVDVVSKKRFWNTVCDNKGGMIYNTELSISVAAKHLRSLIV